MNLLPGKGFAQKAATFAATGFSLGILAPFAPGTFGSLPGVALAIWMSHAGWSASLSVQAAVALALAVAAVPVCGVAERVFKVKDDGRIVADEWMLFPLAVIGLPLWDMPWLAVAAFAVVRAVDIAKPPPADRLQALPGGLGVVADDFAANLYSLAVNWILAIFVFGVEPPF